MMRAVGDNIVELSFFALVAFFMGGIGYLLMQQTELTNTMYEVCIAADKQWIKGDCIR